MGHVGQSRVPWHHAQEVWARPGTAMHCLPFLVACSPVTGLIGLSVPSLSSVPSRPTQRELRCSCLCLGSFMSADADLSGGWFSSADPPEGTGSPCWPGRSGEREERWKLMVASLKIEVLKEKLYASAVFLNGGVSSCQGLLLQPKGFPPPAATA